MLLASEDIKQKQNERFVTNVSWFGLVVRR